MFILFSSQLGVLLVRIEPELLKYHIKIPFTILKFQNYSRIEDAPSEN